MQSEVGRRREVGRRKGVVPGAPVRDAIGTVAGAEVGYREHQCGPVREATGTAAGAEVGYRAHNGERQSAVPSGQRWGTGRTRAGGNRDRRGGRGGVPGARGREVIGTAARAAGGGEGVRCR